jgi:hypothetical protein
MIPPVKCRASAPEALPLDQEVVQIWMAIKHVGFLVPYSSLERGLPNCGMRTTSGTPATVQWYTGIGIKTQQK